MHRPRKTFLRSNTRARPPGAVFYEHPPGPPHQNPPLPPVHSCRPAPPSFTVLAMEAAHHDQRKKPAKRGREKSLVVQVGLGGDPGHRHAGAVADAKSFAK